MSEEAWISATNEMDAANQLFVEGYMATLETGEIQDLDRSVVCSHGTDNTKAANDNCDSEDEYPAFEESPRQDVAEGYLDTMLEEAVPMCVQ